MSAQSHARFYSHSANGNFLPFLQPFISHLFLRQDRKCNRKWSCSVLRTCLAALSPVSRLVINRVWEPLSTYTDRQIALNEWFSSRTGIDTALVSAWPHGATMTRAVLTKLFILVMMAFIICLPEFFTLYRGGSSKLPRGLIHPLCFFFLVCVLLCGGQSWVFHSQTVSSLDPTTLLFKKFQNEDDINLLRWGCTNEWKSL